MGLAGELGAAIILVSEIMDKECWGWGIMLVVIVGAFGAVTANLLAKQFDWQISYFIGGGLGLSLLALRVGTTESGLFTKVQKTTAPSTAWMVPHRCSSALKLSVMGMTAPRTKLGTVVVTVARMSVPNCSAAMVTKSAQ